MSGKIKARNITSQVTGPTFDHNDPAKFRNKGKEHGKTDSEDTVVSQKVGATFTCNDPAISFPEASEYGKGKSLGQHAEKDFNPHGRKPVNVADNPVVTTPSYPLKKSYEK
jgi:hypothetical protein